MFSTLKQGTLAIATGATLMMMQTGFAAAETKLVLSSWLPPKHPIVAKLMKPWAKDIKKATEGRVTVRVLAKPLGPPPAHFDMAVDGVADITYGLHSFTKDDRFLRSRIGQFSFLGDSAVSTSAAYWNVYSGDLKAQEEHKGVKLLGLFVHGPGLFHNNQRPINSVEDFKGLKVRTPGGYIADLAGDLGITTQFMGPGQVFEKLSRGVIDGVTFPIEALKAFKLTKHVTNTMKIPGGIYNTSWFLVMSDKKWASISEADQKAIMALSGEAFAKRAGAVWDAADKAGWDHVNGSSIKVDEAPEAVVAKIRELAGGYEAKWAEALKAQGFDGAKALSDLRAQAAAK